MNLILWRHAEAEDISPDGNDATRRLTARGRQQAERMAAWLNRKLPDDAVILASPAVRTRQTADALGRDYTIEPRLFTDAALAEYLTASRASTPGTATIVLVGHQPTLGLLAATLACGSAQPWSVKKGAVWWLETGGLHQPARIHCILGPKTL